MDRFLSERESADRNFSIGYYLKENQVLINIVLLAYCASHTNLLYLTNYSNGILLNVVLSTWHVSARDHGPLLPGI